MNVDQNQVWNANGAAEVARTPGTPLVRVPRIEKPPSVAFRFLYWLSNRLFGKISSPLAIVYTRIPGFIVPHLWLTNYGESGLSVGKRLMHLIRVWVSRTNHCAFSADMMRYTAASDGMDLALIDALDGYEESPLFTERERAALRYVEELSRHHHVDDAVFARARACLNDKELVEVTFLASNTNFINLLAIPLGVPSDDLCSLLPGEKGRTATGGVASAK